MNCNTQNEKIELLTEEWAIVGVDVGNEKHYARVFTNRKIELSRKAFGFSNDLDGFQAFERWVSAIVGTYKLKFIMCGMEPTGHYWFNLASYMKSHGMMVVHVNPSHVKHSKELDDSNPAKNDKKDPKTIAGLLCDGRYMFPYMPEGIYAEIRELNNLRLTASQNLVRVKNKLERWISIYFPEFHTVFKGNDSKSGRLLKKHRCLKTSKNLGQKE